MLAKWLSILLTALMLLPACATSQDNYRKLKQRYPDLVRLNPPEHRNAEKSKIYVDSVGIVPADSGDVLLLRGHFPDGCTHIGSVSHRINDTVLNLTVRGWRESGIVCTQALVSFSFIYSRLPEQVLQTYGKIRVNGNDFLLNNQSIQHR